MLGSHESASLCSFQFHGPPCRILSPLNCRITSNFGASLAKKRDLTPSHPSARPMPVKLLRFSHRWVSRPRRNKRGRSPSRSVSRLNSGQWCREDSQAHVETAAVVPLSRVSPASGGGNVAARWFYVSDSSPMDGVDA
jgi:hypothetical protein